MTKDHYQYLVGKVVAAIKVRDTEVLFTFTDGSEIAINLATTGGDYGHAYLNCDLSTNTRADW